MSAAADLGRWVHSAERGETFVYARRTKPNVAAKAAARKLHDACLVSLVQRREPDGTVSYIAQRTWRKREEQPPKPVGSRGQVRHA